MVDSFAILVDVAHFSVMVILMLGNAIGPINLVPAIMICQIYTVARFHDYCVFSAISEKGQDVLNGCTKERDFSGMFLDLYSTMGVEASSRLQNNLTTGILGASLVIGLLRLSNKYKFSLIPHSRRYRAIFWGIVVFCILSEIVIEKTHHLDYSPCPTTPSELQVAAPTPDPPGAAAITEKDEMPALIKKSPPPADEEHGHRQPEET